MTPHDLRPVHSTHRPALARFVAAGLRDTVDSFLRAGLPLPRLARELDARTEVLAALEPPARVLTRLRWLHQEVALLHSALHDAGRTELDPGERAQLMATLSAVRDSLATLLEPGPLAPANTAPPGGATATVAAIDVGAATMDKSAISNRPPVAMAAGRAAMAM